MARYKIAVVPGDGIGKEVMPEGLRALEAVGAKFGVDYEFTEFGWNCDDYDKTGRIMPEDGVDQLRRFDAVFLGAVGMPGVPDHVSLWGMLIQIRQEFLQYVNLRPARLLPGVQSPLANRGPEDIDMMIVRENVEGEYSQVGGRMYEGTDEEMAIQQAVFTRRGATGSCATRSSWLLPALRKKLHRPPSPTVSFIPCLIGTNASPRWRLVILILRPTSITSIS